MLTCFFWTDDLLCTGAGRGERLLQWSHADRADGLEVNCRAFASCQEKRQSGRQGIRGIMRGLTDLQVGDQIESAEMVDRQPTQPNGGGG
jgi:hypothetical protein